MKVYILIYGITAKDIVAVYKDKDEAEVEAQRYNNTNTKCRYYYVCEADLK